MRVHKRISSIVITGLFIAISSSAFAELKVEGTGILFYTDDVGLFSATRRLSRDGDPTQPAIDTRLTQGSAACLSRSWTSPIHF